ncbi:restriction endonuclease [Spirosoma sp. SC4-14]|uniref:restriction endonuclease n=1 Tax=Spirosoma sp. SC4-14 TaxID=3128900 RepID=UPI0030CC3358
MSDTTLHEFDNDIITIGTPDLDKTLIKDIPKDSLIEVSDLADNGIYHSRFEGEFGWENEIFCAFVRHDWYRKYWDLPLGLPFHMDLMKRLAEFRASQNKDLTNIQFEDEGDWCHLNYEILIPAAAQTIGDALKYANEILDWIENTVQTAQEGAAGLINGVIEKYNETSLLHLPDLIEKVKTATDIDEMGKYLEELVARFFSEIKGFQIIERKRTKTEEIDIVIVNNAEQSFWKSESNLILVECKNWTKKPAGKNEYVAFREKLENRRGRAKLGFFISAKGFAKTFGLEDLRNSKADLLIVPLDLKQLIEIIEKQLNYSEELQKFYIQATTK